jgi:hypothetical protein
LQMEGRLTREELARALELGVKGCREIYEKMKAALRERYSVSAAAIPAMEAPA